MHAYYGGNLKEKYKFTELGIDRTLILKCNLKKWGGRMCTMFI
jgi:hypothetical protein